MTGPVPCSALSIADAFGSGIGVWRTGGDAPWVVVTNTLIGNHPTVHSGSVAAGQESWLEVEVTEPATLDAAGQGDVAILLDFNTGQTASIDLGTPWQFRGLSLYGGTNVVRWTQRGPGTTWLDSVQLTPDPTAQPQANGAIHFNPNGFLAASSAWIGVTGFSGSTIIASGPEPGDIRTVTGDAINGIITVTGTAPPIIATNIVFGPIKFGLCAGVFYDTNHFTVESSGWFQVQGTRRSGYSGKLQLAGTTYRFSGKTDASGHASNVLRRPPKNPLRIEFQPTAPSATNQSGLFIQHLSGTVSDGTWNVPLTAWPAVFRLLKDTPCRFAGKYTLAIPGDADLPQIAGHGFATLTISAKGDVHCAGALSDGTRFTHSDGLFAPGTPQGTLSTNQAAWPLYAALYRNRGLLLSWLNFTNQPDSDFSGALIWAKPNLTPGTNSSDDCPNSVQAVGSRFTLPPHGARLLAWSTGAVEFAQGNLAQPFTNFVTIQANGRLANQSSNRLSLSLNKSDGRLTGAVVAPGTTKRIPVQGVWLQKLDAGYGYFLQQDRSGSLVFQSAAAPVATK